MVTNWVQHDKLRGGKYPESAGTRTIEVGAGALGKVIDATFSHNNLLQFIVDFDGVEVIVPYYRVALLMPEMRK